MIVEEEFYPGKNVAKVYSKVMKDLEGDPDFVAKIVEDFERDDERFILELTKR